MLYNILIAYWVVRIVFDVLLDDGVNETDIRQCNCENCSGIYILN